jgi:NAD(P)-dependent dehydrogenase (short-subunit alcohol dehydrogenase family)
VSGGDLVGRRIVVTGGASGFGAATARLAAGRGATVVAVDLADRDGIAGTDGIRFATADVTDPDGLADVVSSAATDLGGLDGVFANAGINGMQAPLTSLRPDEWRQTLAVCLDGVFFTLRAAVPHLGAGSSVVVMSSITGSRSFATEGAAAYASAKAGATALAKLAAVELGPRGVRVNVVAPGGVLDTRLLAERTQTRDLADLGHERRIEAPLPGTTTSTDVAELVCFLLSDAASRISGAEIHLDGAQSLLGGGLLKPIGQIPVAAAVMPGSLGSPSR